MTEADVGARLRREPPSFRQAAVVATEARGGRLLRLSLHGPELIGFGPVEPAASVRLLIPSAAERGGPAVTIPVWNGNEFLRADGSRPPIRTLTPLDVDREAGELAVEVVLHGDGPLAAWAGGDPVGDPVAVSGPGRGYDIDPEADAFVLAGDESALPAIATLLPLLPPRASVTVLVELDHEGDEVELPGRAGTSTSTSWLVAPAPERRGEGLLDALAELALTDGTRVWVAGEAAAVQRIRHHLFTDRGLPRSRAVVRGYWKSGRAGAGEA